jgi:non-ribosomal peptide synthetase component F
LPDTQLQRKHWAAYAISQRETCMSLSDRRGTRVRSFDAGQIEFTIEAKVRSQLEQIARQHDATLFIILAASLGVLLHLTTGSSQVAIGSTSDYREPSAFEDVVGMFVSSFTLPLNITPDSSFLQVLQLARHSAILAYQCRDYPLDLVLQELYPDRDLYLQPPFDLKLVLQDERSYLPAESGLNIMPFGPSNAQARHDMTVAVAARDDGLAVTATYSTDQFGPAQAAITMQTWQLLLFQVATSPNSRVSEIGQRVVTTPLGC